MTSEAAGTLAPPGFVTAAGHPVRWRLLSELAHGDLAVRELTALLGQPQSLVSYHLGKLRKTDLVTTRRSNADGRDTYYSLDLTRCRDLLSGAGAALHPGLRLARPEPVAAVTGRVLFLCTGNSARSQMAEALLRDRTVGAVEAFSAGSRPKPVHPSAVEAMAARGIDLSGAAPKHLDEFTGQRFDHVITLCDRVKEVCPEFPGHPRPMHWSTPDPAAGPGGPAAFERVAGELAQRIDFLLHDLAHRSERTS
ncbi:ArsR family transcriptional regulator [Actinoplanes cyaneus]|uniref:ArsR family transcriptional regulator n=1 Tax=Actinoplanes cyaneus TaxID=52696 RepID=A0A919M2H7_9ACTN|nr:metalloregulator ArsR/SmtB family transcription factor [Actinoplanes cyaneus]MCW2142604.1 Protein-tyrosine-phosphatase [Actinoplanes cyaneus]GID62153.1 ArsR family transcriptional regulator [Actinoplanes cyaneus]